MADDFAANGALIKEVSEGYDALGNRITEGVRDAASLTPALQRFAIEGQDVLADLNGGNQMILRYLRGDAVDQVLASEGPRDSLSVQVITPIGGPVSWLLTDRQGSVRDVTDGSGTIVDHIDYGSFGERVAETNPNGGSRYGYTGREWDAALDLQYNRARFYDPATGNFIEEDPSGFSAGDPNLSRYVGNGPTNGTDPSGLHDPNHQPFPTGSSGGLHVLGTIPNPRPLNHEEIDTSR